MEHVEREADDKVLIAGSHPRAGQVGRVVEPMDTPAGRGWAVEIDGADGLQCFAAQCDLRSLIDVHL